MSHRERQCYNCQRVWTAPWMLCPHCGALLPPISHDDEPEQKPCSPATAIPPTSMNWPYFTACPGTEKVEGSW